MAFKRKSALISRGASADDTADVDLEMSVTKDLGPLRSNQLKKSESTMQDTTANDADDDGFAVSITKGLQSWHRSKRPKILVRSSQSNVKPIELDTAHGHNFASVNPANKLSSPQPMEGTRMVKQDSELPLKSVTTHPSQSHDYPQYENYSTSSVSNNGPLDPSAPLSQSPTTPEPGNGYGRSDLTPQTVSLTHTSGHKSREVHKQEIVRLLELPLDVLYLVADHLDVVARVCLGYAHPALACWSKKKPGNLSLCARSRIVSLLERDDVSIPKELLGVARKGSNEGECSEYHNVMSKHCVICRCDGHLSHCPGCRMRTCAREDTEFWRKWTGIVDDDTAFLARTMHVNP